MGDLRNVAHGMRCGLGNRLFCLSVFLIGLFPPIPNLTGNLDYFVSTADAATPVTAPVAWYRFALPEGKDLALGDLGGVPDGNLSALWRFNGNGMDDSGNGNSATGMNGAIFTGEGKFGQGGVLDGVNDYLNIADSASLKLPTAISVEAWIYPNAPSPGEWRTIVAKGNPSSAAEPEIYLVLEETVAGTVVHFVLTDTGGASHWLSGPAMPLTGSWVHLVAAYDGSQSSLYINGVNVATLPWTGTLRTNSRSLLIGANELWGEYFSGRIDEVAVYDTALTPQASLDHFRRGVAEDVTVDDPNTIEANDGNIFGAASASGLFDQALSLDGEDDYVAIPRSANLSFSATGSFTAEGWFRLDADGLPTVRAETAGIIQQCDSGGECTTSSSTGSTPVGRGWLYIGQADDTIRTNVGSANLSSGVAVTPGTWYHAAVVYDNGTVTLYVNGVAKGSSSATYEESTGGYVLGTGKGSYRLKGRLDEVRILDRALTPEEVAREATPPPPADPSNLAATAVSESRINLAWMDHSDVEEGFKIEKGTDGVIFSEIATVGADATVYSVTGLSPSTLYYFRVRAFNRGGLSGYTIMAGDTTLSPGADGISPTPPSNLTATAIDPGRIDLTWGASTDNVGVTGYRVERCEGDACTNFTLLAAVTATDYSDVGLVAATSYSYRIQAVDGAGNLSLYSNMATTLTRAVTVIRINNVYNRIRPGVSEAVIGLGFGAQPGVGKVELCDIPSCAGALSDQIVESWSDTAIVMTIVSTALPDGTVYLRVANKDGRPSNAYPLILDTTAPALDGTTPWQTKRLDGTSLEGASVYKKDPVYIRMSEGTFDVKTFTAITIRDSAGMDVTSDALFYDDAGAIKIQPPSAGWPVANNPLRIQVGSSLTDAAANPVTNPGIMTAGFYVSPSITELSENPVDIDYNLALRGSMLRKIHYNGDRYYLFWAGTIAGGNVGYCVGEKEVVWNCYSQLPTNMKVGSGYSLDVHFGSPSSYYPIWVGSYNEMRAFTLDSNTPSLNRLKEETVLNQSVYCNGTTRTTSVRATSVGVTNGTPMMAIKTSGNVVRLCVSNPSGTGYGGDVYFDDASSSIITVASAIDGYVAVSEEGLRDESAIVLYSSGTKLYAKRWPGTRPMTLESAETVTTALASNADWSWAKTATKLHVLFKNSANQVMHTMRTIGSCAANCWTPAVQVGTTTAALGCCGVVAVATYDHKDGIVALFTKQNDIYKNVFNGISWEPDSAVFAQDVAPNNLSSSIAATGAEPTRIPFAYEYNNVCTEPCDNWELRVSFLGHDPVANYSGNILTQEGNNLGAVNRYYEAQTDGVGQFYLPYRHRSTAVAFRRVDSLTGEVGNEMILSADARLKDSHNAPSAFLDQNSGHLYVLYGGRDDLETVSTPLWLRKTSLPVSDPNFKDWMWDPKVDTGLAPTICTRGYKFPISDSNGMSHLLCLDVEGAYIANNQYGDAAWSETLTKVVDVSCIDSYSSIYFLVHGVAMAPNGDIGIIWSPIDEGVSPSGVNLYFTRINYDPATHAYRGARADGSWLSLPHQPVESGCYGSAADRVYNGLTDGKYGSAGGIVFDVFNRPLIAFHKTDTADFDVHFTRWDGTQWTPPIDTTINSNAKTRIFHTAGTNWVLIVSSQEGSIVSVQSNDLGGSFGPVQAVVPGGNPDVRLNAAGEAYPGYLVLFDYLPGKTVGDGWGNRPWSEIGYKYME